MAAADGAWSEKAPIYRKQSEIMTLDQAKEVGIAPGAAGPSAAADNGPSPTATHGSSLASSSRIPGRRLPPRLNLDAVRDAEARGSLTSLPDLIRRATKLAAVLETGRPGSRAWGHRSSVFGLSNNSSSMSCPVLSCPVLSCPVLSCPVLSCPVLSCPFLSFPALSFPLPSTPLSSPPLPSPLLSSPPLSSLLSILTR